MKKRKQPVRSKDVNIKKKKICDISAKMYLYLVSKANKEKVLEL